VWVELLEDPALAAFPKPDEVPDLVLELVLVVSSVLVLAVLLVVTLLIASIAPVMAAVARVEPARIPATMRRALETAGLLDISGRLLCGLLADYKPVGASFPSPVEHPRRIL